MKILLAEDDKNLGRLLQNLLKKENIKKIGADMLECEPEEVDFDGEKVYLTDGEKSVKIGRAHV